jgi:hypothetical protein
MNAIIQRIPGILGVLGAYLALRLAWLLGFHSIAGEIILLVIVYLLVTWLAERALRHYDDSLSPPL